MVMLNSDRIKKKGQPDYPILFSYICFLDSIVSKVVSRKDIHQPKHSKFTRKRENSAWVNLSVWTVIGYYNKQSLRLF